MNKPAALVLATASAVLALVAFPHTGASQPLRRAPAPVPTPKPIGQLPVAPVPAQRLGTPIVARPVAPITLADPKRQIRTLTDLNGQMYGAGPRLIALLSEDGKISKTFPTTIAQASIAPHGVDALVVGDLSNKTVSLFDVNTGALKPLFSLAKITDASPLKAPGGHLLRDGKLAAVASDGKHVFVSIEAGFSSAIFKIDPATSQVVERAWASAADPSAMVYQNGALFVLVGSGSQIRRFTPTLQRSRDNIELPAGGATGIGIRGAEIRALSAARITRSSVSATDLAAQSIAATIDQVKLAAPRIRVRPFPPLDVAKRYAVLITGDLAENFWGECFWNDTVWMYKTLLANGYAADDIFVLYGDGADYASPNPAYRHPTRVTDFPANSANVLAVLDGLKNGDAARGIPKMDSNDTLFVWTFDHGGRSNNESTLCLRDGCMPESTLSPRLNAIAYGRRAVFMQQCFSGGFIDTLQNDKTYISTASRADETSHPADTENETVGGRPYSHGEYNYWVISALNRLTPLGAAVNADSNADTFVSAAEAHAWNASHESRSETPQVSDPGGTGPIFKMKK